MHIEEFLDLKPYNTFHVSAQARYFIHVKSLLDLQEALAFCGAKQLPYVLIGSGSNILFKQDYPGVVIELTIRGIESLEEDDTQVLIKANCGENWHDFVMYCLDQGYYGLENLSLIPGTVGASPVQNIGAYGVELADICHSVETLEVATGEAKHFSNLDCNFSYRSSTFKTDRKDQYIISSVTFRLSKVPELNVEYPALANALIDHSHETITPELVSKVICNIRRSKLPNPNVIGNAGSFFWNPIIDKTQYEQLKETYTDIPGYPEDDDSKIKVPAAWLIDQSGWKGHREGSVGVHAQHALVLVNHGEARGEELCELALKIIESVKQKFQIQLFPEVRII